MPLYLANIDDYEHIPNTLLNGLNLTTQDGLNIEVLEVDEKFSIVTKPNGSGIVSSTGTLSYREVQTGDTKIVTLSEFISLIGFDRYLTALESGIQKVTQISQNKAITLLENLKNQS